VSLSGLHATFALAGAAALRISGKKIKLIIDDRFDIPQIRQFSVYWFNLEQ
jgi:hypothetical protein